MKNLLLIIFIIVLSLLKYSFVQAQVSNLKLELVFSANMGKKPNEIGGFTSKEILSKEDPGAFGDSVPQDFAVYDNIYIADYVNNSIKVFNKKGNLLNIISSCNKVKLAFPNRITVANHKIIVGSPSNGSAYLFKNDNTCVPINYSSVQFKSSKDDLVGLIFNELDEVSINQDNIYIYGNNGKIFTFNDDGLFKEASKLLNYDNYFMHTNPTRQMLTRYDDVKININKNGYNLLNIFSINENGTVYLLASKDSTNQILKIDENNDIISKSSEYIGNYYIIRWFSSNGNNYVMGINNKKKNGFVKIYKILE